ncbi:MAG: hypothetical protein H0X24_05135 [Ktedonobacterales bacterium]|nr:hypothetical protein [Ktedonobacterales bacterium]
MAESLPDVPRRPVVVAPEIPSRDAMDAYIVARLPLAARLAHRFADDEAGWSECFQDACLGLVELVRHLMPEAMAAEPAHAEALVVLAMRHRLVNALARRAVSAPSLTDFGVRHWVGVQPMRRVLVRRLDREPAPDELAAALGLPLSLIHALLAATARPASLEDLASAGLEVAEDHTSAAEAERVHLRDAVRRLPQPERFIIQAQYGIGMSRVSVLTLAHTLAMAPRRIIALRRHGLALLRALLLEG